MGDNVEVEGLRINGFLIEDILKEDFVKELNKDAPNLDIAALIFVKKDKTPPVTIILNHQSSKEIEEKVLHLNCPDGDLLKKFSEIIKKRIKK